MTSAKRDTCEPCNFRFEDAVFLPYQRCGADRSSCRQGVITVPYNAEAQTLKDVEEVMNRALRDQENIFGVVTISFADASPAIETISLRVQMDLNVRGFQLLLSNSSLSSFLGIFSDVPPSGPNDCTVLASSTDVCGTSYSLQGNYTPVTLSTR